MFAKLFGKKSDAELSVTTKQALNLSFLHTDLHSHFIPGIDDGAQTIEDSISLITAMQQMGYGRIITTPHIKADRFPNNRAIIENGLHMLQQALAEKNIILPVTAAAEYYLDDHFLELLDSEPLLTLKDNIVLVEFSFMSEPAMINDIIFRIQMAGYRMVLAHPERYAYFHQNFSVFNELKNRGVQLQLNLLALTGYYGQGVKRAAEYLLDNKLYDYCGTDMHHIKHAEEMQKILQSKYYTVLQAYPFLNNKLT